MCHGSIEQAKIIAKAIIIIIAIIGLGLGIVSISETIMFKKYQKNGIITNGEIIHISINSNESSDLVLSEIKYISNAGEEFFIKDNTNGNYRIGDSIKIIYLDDTPEKAKVYSNSILNIAYLYLFMIACLSIATLLVFNFKKTVIILHKYFGAPV
ncbi:DUF3592 domain-containing protein [Cytophaga hutchinsonii]|uniref:DUF3592 domain-containing protein n=1 Tax=Cytophaga hutchinsonii (strain ATCC 33406 / DSM 1761 / CIP 103989 / NBRC 15051 / NCIMB 9469 / D465) TaxID=269798 RepID=A0A6N4SVJ1_CYTH3|nr:DUF3592 domain-containing protein [Cytophaga hutchinsonii]ABG60446.1 hypothetical protein CHU_3206 [Cytophaga hutchinsonii ATCC 33406]SFX85787.1 hypothetical protein SAMN04487930_11173 [Cytophaga hutchinsonii ATCC 33406]